jgi:hypothetical protein
LSGAANLRVWTPAELAVLAPLAQVKRVPPGALGTAARQLDRTTTAVCQAVSDLRTGKRSVAPDAQAAAPAPKRATFEHGTRWTAAELAVLLPLVRAARARPGQVQAAQMELGRSLDSIYAKLRDLRLLTNEELARLEQPAPMREAPRADGSGPLCLPGSPTLTAAVQAHAPRPVSSAAGAVRAAPDGFSGAHGSMHSKRHLAELRAAHPPEVVPRKCSSCRAPFVAPSRFRFRCDGCLRVHTGAAYTGLDA